MRPGHYFALFTASLLTICLITSCSEKKTDEKAMPNGEFAYNVPCKVVNIHQEKEGKSILFLWLHGGVHDVAKHDLFAFNHLDCCAADDSVLNYLEKKDIKAVALFPVCYKASLDHSIAWRDCYDDVKHIIDDYIAKGLIDTDRIYLAGSSDGGTGTWDYVENHGEMFAAAIAQSCGRPRMTAVPTYFFNTASEHDCTAEVDSVLSLGSNILLYKYCSECGHGGDAAECTEAFLDDFFSHVKNK
ncbi:MAG: prolyl oligopeptidase family serine peptidase [Bacteroidales bacterium]|nr:prolyl oligopeptidase family serine peptidase [Candidatus Cacconaster merdequi]